MAIEELNRKRFLHSIETAMKHLESDAVRYYYKNESEYQELVQFIQIYRNNVNCSGIRYIIYLDDTCAGFFLEGTVSFSSGKEEPLQFYISPSSGNNDCFMVQEVSLKKADYPVRWHILPNNELFLYHWDERVHRIAFWNPTDKDITITVGKHYKKVVQADHGDWFIHPSLYKLKE